ncbi:histone-lysine N-methyltransferase SMYD3 [Spea bombifrons]|uniref:histone-lysine N-methyltransferase SMYD3 n=1 Tax=Spea bombifrons TaxID=233779 RepID=UPI0023497F73|nr:histone-lysine N-methyltransferase SMYD3 [Spea bombifrons]
MMAGSFEKFISTGKGNGLRATRRLNAGVTVASMQPYVYTVCRGKKYRAACDYCLRRSTSLQRCSQCKFARYCNSTCQKAAWQDHKRECVCLKSILPNVPTDSVRLVGRIIFKLLQQSDSTSEELYSISDLQSHIEDLSEDMKEGLRQLVTALELYIRKEIQDSSQLPPGCNILEYFGKVTCNSFTISDGEMQDVGVGLFPSMSLLNHSCDPNCVIAFEGRYLNLRTVREIPKGEELTISYIDVMMPTHQRQNQLKRQYCFTCNCHRCLSNDKDKDMLAGDEQAWKEMECSLSRLEEMRSQDKGEEALEICKALLKTSQLPDRNIYQLRILDFAMDVCIDLGHWEEAQHFGLRTLEPYGLYYSNYHPVKAIQMMKVGKLQHYLDQFPEAMKTLKEALAIMTVTHGKDHSLMKDLTELLQDCTIAMNAA